MASSGNFATLNPLAIVAGGTLSDGNLKASSDANADYHIDGTMGVNPNDTQGYYFEVRIVSRITNMAVGFGRNLYYTGSFGSSNNQSYVMAIGSASEAGDVRTLTSTNTSFRQSFADGDIIGVAIKGGKIWFAKNNTYINSGNPAGDSGEAISGATGTLLPVWFHAGGSGTNTQYFNFGADDTFGGAITGAGNADANGFGVFKYAPPTGFLALCSGNLSVSDDIDPAQTDDDYPSKQFGVVTYTGDNSTSNAITGLGFQPDLVWIKARNDNNAYSNALFDTSRGRAKSIFSDSTRVQNTSSSTQDLVSFDSDGFTVGTSYNTASNLSGKTHVAWCWKCAGGITASNSEGSITNTLQANTKAGFSISSFTCPSSGAGTLGHGLEKAPDFFIFKPLGAGTYWRVWHKDFATPLRSVMYLQLSAGENAGASDVQQWNNTLPSSTLISLGGGQAGEGASMLYACHGVEGYSKFGSYKGNANNDGPFIYTGFRPRLIMIKQLEQTGTEWGVYDTARCTSNPNGRFLFWNGANVENDGESFHCLYYYIHHHH